MLEIVNAVAGDDFDVVGVEEVVCSQAYVFLGNSNALPLIELAGIDDVATLLIFRRGFKIHFSNFLVTLY